MPLSPLPFPLLKKASTQPNVQLSKIAIKRWSSLMISLYPSEISIYPTCLT